MMQFLLRFWHSEKNDDTKSMEFEHELIAAQRRDVELLDERLRKTEQRLARKRKREQDDK